MGLYDNAYPSVYEEIKRFYPIWYWDMLEMDAIWRVQGTQLNRARDAVEVLIADQFVATADEETISALEAFLYLPSDTKRSLTERRQIVASFFLDAGRHFGLPEIREIMKAFTDAPVNAEFEAGIVTVRINKDSINSFTDTDCYSVLSRKIPAHLELVILVINPIEAPLFRAITMTEYHEEEIS